MSRFRESSYMGCWMLFFHIIFLSSSSSSCLWSTFLDGNTFFFSLLLPVGISYNQLFFVFFRTLCYLGKNVSSHYRERARVEGKKSKKKKKKLGALKWSLLLGHILRLLCAILIFSFFFFLKNVFPKLWQVCGKVALRGGLKQNFVNSLLHFFFKKTKSIVNQNIVEAKKCFK